MSDLDGVQELLAADHYNATMKGTRDRLSSGSQTLTIAEQKRVEYIDQQTARSLAVHQAQVKNDVVRMAVHFHKIRTDAEAIGGTIVSIPMGFISGAISAALDGTATGISLVAPVAAPALAMLIVSLALQTISLEEPFTWTIAGRMMVYASWRSAIVLFATLTITGALMWWQNRTNSQIADSLHRSYGDKK